VDYRGGEINYLCNHQDAIFFVQRNKCGHIPVDRNLISDASGSSTLITSSKFLGSPRYYAGTAGCDGNPESVVDVDNTAYFAHKSFGKVFKVSGVNGVNVISDAGMSSFFRDEFAAAIDDPKAIRVVGGYDPVKKEYLLTVLNKDVIPTSQQSVLPDVQVVDPIVIEDVESEIIEVVGGEIDITVEEPPVPRVSVDWSSPNNFGNVQFTTHFLNGGNNLFNELSTWAVGSEVNYQIIDLSIRVKIENAGLIDDGSPISMAFQIFGRNDDYSENIWTFSGSGITNIDEVLSNLSQAGYPSDNLSDHLSLNFKDVSSIYSSSLLNQIVNGHKIAVLTVSSSTVPEEYLEGTYIVDIPLRFICESDNLGVAVDSIPVGNQGGSLVGDTTNTILLSANGEVYRGDTEDLITQSVSTVNGKAVWLPLPIIDEDGGTEDL